LSDFGKRIRLNRLFKKSPHKLLVVAFDHAMVLGPIHGTVDPSGQVKRIAAHGVDGILLNLGILHECVDSLVGHVPPCLILRLDWTSAWFAASNGGKLRSELLVQPEQALQNGADAVLTYLFVGTGDYEFEAREIARNAQVARECERLGIPLIVETIARGKDVENPLSAHWLNMHTRIAAELGADVIKTEYAGSPEAMREVVDTCPIPIVILGGAKQPSEEQALEVVRGSVAAGAAGVFMGRNIFQSADMSGFLEQVRSILDGKEKHDRVSKG
jgi:DhnA family fructose-bisphosphate aldolase class Ia